MVIESSRSILILGFMLVMFGLAPKAADGQTKLGLSINDQKIAPVGQLESFIYKPGIDSDNDGVFDTPASFEVKTFFGDVRCDQLQPFDPETSLVTLELDQVIKGEVVEPEAKYDISGVESIVYNPATGEVSITVAEGEDAGCTHEIPAIGVIYSDGTSDPGTFWSSGFDPLFNVSYELPGLGAGFRIRVRNTSPITALREIGIHFSAPGDSSFEPALGSVSWDEQSGTGVWSIPLLWPQGADDDESVIDVLTADVAEGVSVAEISSLSRESYPAIGPALITVVNTSTRR